MMEFNKKSFQITLFVFMCFCNTSLQHRVKKLDFTKGGICQEGKGLGLNYMCLYAEDCDFLENNFGNNKCPDICSLDQLKPIYCCPPIVVKDPPRRYGNTNSRLSIVEEKCQEYMELANGNFQRLATSANESEIRFKTFNKNEVLVGNCESELQNAYDEVILINETYDYNLAVAGYLALPRQFPHMAILGYGERLDDNMWGCGGSLISERWILTAAHCEQMGSPEYLARWARLGDLNLATTKDDTRPKDYKIIQRVIYPCYTPPSKYNDVALFRLETDVKFSEYVRPICLNQYSEAEPIFALAPGWGKTAMGEPMSDDLSWIHLRTISTEVCNASYASTTDKTLKFGILTDRMICAGSSENEPIQDTCQGDSGGPLQSISNNHPNIYTQYGINSFGKHCGDRDSPGVYTRVSKYITWIESVVWPTIK